MTHQLERIKEQVETEEGLFFYYSHTANVPGSPNRAISMSRSTWDRCDKDFAALVQEYKDDALFSLLLPEQMLVGDLQNKMSGLLNIHFEGTRDPEFAVLAFRHWRKNQKTQIPKEPKKQEIVINCLYNGREQTNTVNEATIHSDLLKKMSTGLEVRLPKIYTTDINLIAEAYRQRPLTPRLDKLSSDLAGKQVGIIGNTMSGQIVDLHNKIKILKKGDIIKVDKVCYAKEYPPAKVIAEEKPNQKIAVYSVYQWLGNKAKPIPGLRSMHFLLLEDIEFHETEKPVEQQEITDWSRVRVLRNLVHAIEYDKTSGEIKTLCPGDEIIAKLVCFGKDFHSFTGCFAHYNDKKIIVYSTKHPYYPPVSNFLPVEDVVLVEKSQSGNIEAWGKGTVVRVIKDGYQAHIYEPSVMRCRRVKIGDELKINHVSKMKEGTYALRYWVGIPDDSTQHQISSDHVELVHFVPREDEEPKKKVKYLEDDEYGEDDTF